MRVNIEDDLRTSGRLSKLARTMKWSEREALGALVMIYRATQAERIITTPIERLLTVVGVAFDNDEQCERFVRAMIKARLAEETADGVTIKGNQQQIERLDGWLQQKRDAGRKSAEARKLKKLGERPLNDRSTKTNDAPTKSNPPVSCLLSPPPDSLPPSGVGSPAPGDSLSEYSVSTQDAAELVEHWQTERDERGKARVLVVPDAWLTAAKRIIAAARGLENAKRIVSAFVRSDHGFWSKAEWEFTLLDQPRDFTRAVMLVGQGAAEDDREPLPWANDGKDWEAWHARQQSLKAASA